MILLPWDRDRCPNCAASVVPRWWKLHRESRVCPACGGKVELSNISRSLLGGIWMGFVPTALFLLFAVAADPGWGSLALAMATIVAIAWILTWLPLAVPQGNVQAGAVSTPWPGRAATHVAAAAALSALAAGFLVAAMAFEFPGQVFTLIVLGAGIGVSVAMGLLFDLPLGAAMSANERLLERWRWPRQPWLRRFLRDVVRLAIFAVLAVAFVKAITLLD